MLLATCRARALFAFLLAACWLEAIAVEFTVDSTAAAIHNPATPAGMGVRCTALANDCTLYDARIEADGALGADRIVFSIPLSDPGCNGSTGICRIETNQSVAGGGSAALTFSGPVEIDASTQPGALPNTLTTLDGGLDMQLKIEMGGPPPPSAIGGLRHLDLAGGGVIRGIAFSRMPSAIKASPSAGSELRIEGCVFGSSAANALMVPPPVLEADEHTVWNAIEIAESSVVGAAESVPRVIVGGTTPDKRNWFASHQRALRIHGTPVELSVFGNVIGTDKDARGRNSDSSGIAFSDWIAPISVRSSVQIGAADVGARNYFGGQFVLEAPVSAGAVRVQGNYIGVQPDGTTTIPRSLGFATVGAGYLVGGLLPGEGNVFNVRNGSFAVKKRAVGPGSQIGGMSQVLGNRYLGSVEAGYTANDSPVQYEFRVGAGLKNDAGDADQIFSGLRLQNWPVISAYSVVGDQLTLTYRIDASMTNSNYDLIIEFYLHGVSSGGATRHDFIARDIYPAASAMQQRTVTLTVPPELSLPADPVIVASATSATAANLSGETSEFSFHDVSLAWDVTVPAVFPVNQATSIKVNVSSSAPFKPHGLLKILRTDPNIDVVICEGLVTPVAGAAAVSSLTCNFTPNEIGAMEISAYWAGSGTTFHDVSAAPASATITRAISVQTISIDLFKNGFESDPNAP